MDFNNAIIKMIDESSLDVLKDAFRMRSILYDFVGSSIYDKKLVDVFCHIAADIDFNDTFTNLGLSKGREEFKSKFVNYKTICTASEYVDAINPISSIICKDEYLEYQKSKKQNVEKKIVEAVSINKAQNTVLEQKTLLAGKKQQVAAKVMSNPIINQNRDISKIKGIVIKTKDQNIRFKSKSSGSICVFKGDSKRSMSLSKYPIINNKLYLDFVDMDDNITISLNTNIYESLNITSNGGNILIERGYRFPLCINHLKIKTVTGDISVECRCMDLKINSEFGAIKIAETTGNITAHSEYGKIFYSLPNTYSQCKIDLYTKYNDILLDFKKNKAIAIKAFIKARKNHVNFIYRGPYCIYNFNAKSEYLRVRL